MSINLLRLIVLLFFLSFLFPLRADVVVIAARDSGIGILSDVKLKKLWLGKTKKISGVGRVFVADQDAENHQTKVFYKNIIKKKPAHVRAYWAKIQFIGKGFPPKRFDDDLAVMKWIKKANNRIGYIDEGSLTDDFIVLKNIVGDSDAH